MLQLHNLPMFATHIQCKKTYKHFQSFTRDTCNGNIIFRHPIYFTNDTSRPKTVKFSAVIIEAAKRILFKYVCKVLSIFSQTGYLYLSIHHVVGFHSYVKLDFPLLTSSKVERPARSLLGT